VTIPASGDKREQIVLPIRRALVEQMPSLVDSDILRAVDGSLHEPPDGLTPAGSFKTRDAFGNLQLTFFNSASTCVADVDIDDAAGLGHVFQVARNHLRESDTSLQHPPDPDCASAPGSRLSAGAEGMIQCDPD
jgi:hypothetical protein